jgi:plastocyanin
MHRPLVHGPRPASLVTLLVALAALVAGSGTRLALAQRAVPLEVTITDANGAPLADAAVWLEQPTGRNAARPASGVEIAQSEKQFRPGMSVVPVGTTIQFPNRDTVRHHVYSFSPAKTFEIKLYAGTPPKGEVFDKPGIVVLGCNIHDHMIAWVQVVDSNLHATSAANGVARIAGVPPGTWRVRAWHPALGRGEAVTRQLTVGSEAANLAVALAAVAGAKP